MNKVGIIRVNVNDIHLVNADALSYIKTLPEDCIDLIVTDPPYFRVKDYCPWDNQWDSVSDYLGWLDALLSQFWRVLKHNGSLYLFCGHRLAADIERLVRERFKVLNHIIWAKPSGKWRKSHKASLRCYFPATERILFAEHYQALYQAKTSDYISRCRQLKNNVFAPLIEYFKQAKQALAISAKQIEQATGKQMTSHWFGYSQWQLPCEDDYHKLQRLFERVASKNHLSNPLSREYPKLISEHHLLKIKYHELIAQYQLVRRYFSVTAEVKYTDVWDFSPVSYYPGKHPCEKPAAMLEHIINSSSREGDLVADFFMGSGSTIKAALKLNRRCLGVELEQKWFEQIKQKIERLRI
ncbi:site-specific DNA-methyltransferase [Arsenophonus sp. aPb]|uniref:DNA-methyltransferase n=1 Tax=Arsenophonus sp. aPb TaxID=3041619 RepID=UPI002468EB6B|nr:site-specific DNA-methyltransferase [Arsenophonus sp. aPb]WGL99700.1 site-specific DNA-methyltransferase [Arsenophonus sp. aPb]